MSSTPESTICAEFTATLELYSALAKRQKKSCIFLQRAWRPRQSRERPDGVDLPTVRYISGHGCMAWKTDVSHLRCCFCAEQPAVRFAQEDLLMDHLRACHGRFCFALQMEKQSYHGSQLLVVEVKLQSGLQCRLASQPDKLHAWDTEAVYANAAKYPFYAVVSPQRRVFGPWKTTRYITNKPGLSPDASGSGEAGDAASAPFSKKRRVALHFEVPLADSEVGGVSSALDVQTLYSLNAARLAEAAEPDLSFSFDGSNFFTQFQPGLETGAANASAGSSRRRTRDPRELEEDDDGGDEVESVALLSDDESPAGDTPPSSQGAADELQVPPSNGRAVNRRCAVKAVKQTKETTSKSSNTTFGSFREGLSKSILYSSVLQTRPRLVDLDSGQDSDGQTDEVVDEDWRLKMKEQLMEEYSDNSPQETCYTNVWNQFILREEVAYSDRRQLYLVSKFACRYGPILFKMKLQVIFVRHLQEMYRRGLIDAAGLHSVVLEAGKARVMAESDLSIITDRLSQFSFINRISGSEASKKKGSFA